MDHEIEVWTQLENHYAECSCGWGRESVNQSILEAKVRNHRKEHADKGDSVEIV